MGLGSRTASRLIHELILVAFLVFISFNGELLASTLEFPLQVKGDRLTGHLSQVTLRAVLEELQKQLGITYEVPAGELDKVISVDLNGEPILEALAKILTTWDYAYTVNSAGHLQFLYITAKAPPGEAVTKKSEPTGGTSFESLAETEFNPHMESGQGGEIGGVDPSLSHEGGHESSSSTFASPPVEAPELMAPVAGVPMAIQPVPAGTTMPMVPASGGQGMQVNPVASPPNMPIIPATAYPPMDIQPVPDYLKEEMLRNIQP